MTKFLYAKLFFFLICISPFLAMADYSISPVKVFFKPNDKMASISLKNGNDDEASFQLALYKWTRIDGKDVYEESKDVTVTPVMFRIKPGESQLIRLAPKPASKTGAEKAYRLFLKELPTKQPTEANVVNVVMQFGVPIFVEPSKKEGNLTCNIATKENSLDLSCKNNHNQHTLISTLELKDNEEIVTKQEINKYVFPNESVTVAIEKPETNVKSGNLITYYRGSKIETPLTIE